MPPVAPRHGPKRLPPADPDLRPPPPRSGKHLAIHRRRILRAAGHAATALSEVLSLAVPADCVCCGAEDLVLCVACQRRIRLLTRRPFRSEAQAPALMDVGGTFILPVVAAGIYREELAQALLSFKKHGQHQLRHVLGKALAGAVAAAVGEEGGVCLVPVPSSTGAFVKRGFSPVHLLIGPLARAPGPAGVQVRDVLRKSARHRRLESLPGGQKGLGRGARARRVRGSMRVPARQRKGVAGLRCIIVDDVLTTGATLSEAARALHAAGAIVAGAVVLAATRPPDSAGGGTTTPEAGGGPPDLEKNKPRKGE
ncbi:MAG: phosphoribosyltransferase family protein [Arthrobacter sp.]